VNNYIRDIVKDASQIEPTKWYTRGSLSGLRFHRGRILSEALLNDPVAPTSVKVRANLTLTYGADIIAYLSSYNDEIVEQTVEVWKAVEAETARLSSEFDAKLKDIHKKVAIEELEALQRAERAIHAFIRDNTLDITKAASATCGVYFLKCDGVIVYVGQSRAVYGRIAQHRSENRKRFDQVLFLPCERDQLNEFEGFFINLLKPMYNGGNADSRNFGAPISNLWKEVSELFT